MNRWIWFSLCAFFGLVMLLCGLLVPAHLRAVDVSIIERAGRGTSSLLEHAAALAHDGHLGAAEVMVDAARKQSVSGTEQISSTLAMLSAQHPDWKYWGMSDANLAALFSQDATVVVEPFTDFAVRQKNREKILSQLELSQNPTVQQLIRFRAVTNTAVFPPSMSASGQALDAALAVCGLLVQEGKLSPPLSNSVYSLVLPAVRGDNTQPFEELLLDFMSLGQRFNWDQLALFVAPIKDTVTVRDHGNLVRKEIAPLAVLFSAVELSQDAAGASRFLLTYGHNGPADLATSLGYRAGGVAEMLRCNQRLYGSHPIHHLAVAAPLRPWASAVCDLTWRAPTSAFILKWCLLFVAGFLLALAGHFAWPKPIQLERPLQVRGFHMAREVLFALGFLVVVLLLSEPFLARESQKVEFPLRLRLPTVGNVVPTAITSPKPKFMNQINILPLLLFFVLQALIYTACVVKLAEIRRQKVPSRIKLKLLENEEHLFDAGLYLGFVGTIISFILVSLGISKLSLMAAYSSTSFGIIFVSFFKIFHLRPARRKLLLEAEAASPRPVAPAAEPAYAAQP